MKITSDDVRHVARLARITLIDEQVEIFRKQLNDIVEYVEKLNEIETSNIEPTSHIVPLNNIFREDLMIPSLPRQEMLRNAPDSNERFYIVPKIIE